MVAKVQSTQPQKLLGLTLVTTAALLFGVVAACVKAIHLPTLVLQQLRSMIEWALGVATVLFYRRKQKADGQKVTDLVELLIGPPNLRVWIFLRALLYWCFLACWWSSLNCMPIGDATAIVYVGPVFTATFAYIFLGESIDWTFYPIVLLDAIGLILICQPSFMFGDSGEASGSPDGGSYAVGAFTALIAAIVSGLLPVCTRKSKACVWTAINHCSSLLSMLVFTPSAILVWTLVDPAAKASAGESFGLLFGMYSGSTSVETPEETSTLARWGLLLGATAVGYLALAMQTKGYQMEEAARASIMTVLEIPFSYVLQYVLFSQAMSTPQIIGAGLICAATLVNIVRRMQQSD